MNAPTPDIDQVRGQIGIEHGLKVLDVTIPAWGGRDAGKTFRITEMPAAQAERWGWRMMLVLKGSNGNIPMGIASMGMVAVAIVTLNAFLQSEIDHEKLQPLLDEMLGCVTMVRDKRRPELTTKLTAFDIMEVKTRLWLRSEVLRLHTDFSPADALSALFQAIQTLTPQPPPDSKTA